MREIPPRVREDLEFIPVMHEGKRYVLVRDHLGLVREGAALPPELCQIMAFLDGKTPLSELQGEMTRQNNGLFVTRMELDAVISQIDAAFLLESDNFQTARDDIRAGFAAARERPCSHCGQVYPENPFELEKWLDAILKPRGGEETERTGSKVKGLIAPHIDPEAGARTYSRAYQAIRGQNPSRVVVLGVGHQLGDGLYSLSDKDFQTPLGVVENEPDIVRSLRQAGGDFTAKDDFAHRSEHSIEFQLLFLQRLLRPGSFTVIPILCGVCQLFLQNYDRGSFLDLAGPFLKQIRRIVNQDDKPTLVVAGVDLSHVGPKFGHDRDAETLAPEASDHDRSLLQSLSLGDARGLWKESARVEDRYNVCGFTALASLAEILPGARGELLDYEVRHEPATASSVAFAAMVYQE